MSKKVIIPISPWDNFAQLRSPNGLITAEITAKEIAPGAPTEGTLKLTGGTNIEGCNPSMAWSDDSQYLALPHWTLERMQRLLVISFKKNMIGFAPGLFKVLELTNFVRGKINAVDSPILAPKLIEINLSEIIWE